MPSSGLTEMPSVRKQAASNTRSSLAPAASTLGSPVGSGNPKSDIFSSTICPEAMKSLLSEFKSCQSHDLDQCPVSRETSDTQRDLTVIDHFFDSVFLVHCSASLSLSCVVPSGHLTYRFAGGFPK